MDMQDKTAQAGEELPNYRGILKRFERRERKGEEERWGKTNRCIEMPTLKC